MRAFVNLYRVEVQGNAGCNGSDYSSECYRSAEIAREKYEEAADHPWLKYLAVSVPVDFEIDMGLRK